MRKLIQGTVCFQKRGPILSKKRTRLNRTLRAHRYGPATIIRLIGHGGSTIGCASLEPTTTPQCSRLVWSSFRLYYRGMSRLRSVRSLPWQAYAHRHFIESKPAEINGMSTGLQLRATLVFSGEILNHGYCGICAPNHSRWFQTKWGWGPSGFEVCICLKGGKKSISLFWIVGSFGS